MFLTDKSGIHIFYSFLNKTEDYEDIIELDLLPNAPQSAIDAFEKYKEMMKEYKEKGIE